MQRIQTFLTLLARYPLALGFQESTQGQPKPAPQPPNEVDFKAALAGPGWAPSSVPFEAELNAFLRSQAGAIAVAGPPRALPDSIQTRSWTRKIDHLSFDLREQGTWWVRGAGYKASVDAQGFTFVPFLGSSARHNWPVRLTLEGATVGDRSLEFAAGAVQRNGETISIDRGALVESYRFELGAVEQIFVVSGLPIRGELVLSLSVDSDLAASAQGEGALFQGPEGGVQYGGLTVFDDAGRTIQAPARLEHGRIELRVPSVFVEQARLPLTIDPVITPTFTVEGQSGIKAGGPDVAYDATHDRYAVSWQEEFSATDSDIAVKLVDAVGNQGLPLYVDITSDLWTDASVANNELFDNFLIAAQAVNEIRGRILTINNQSLGPVVTIASSSDGFTKRFPSVGGDPSLAAPTYYLVAFERHFSASDLDIHAQLVTGAGALLGAPILIENSGGTIDIRPAVSKTNGRAPASSQVWNVAWGRGPVAGNFTVPDLWAAQLRWDGTVVTPSFNLTLSAASELAWEYSCSPPLQNTSGSAREWAVYHTVVTGSARDAHLRLMRGNTTYDDLDVGQLMGLGNSSFLAGSVDADDAALALAFDSGGVVGLANFVTTGHALALAEGPIVVNVVPAQSWGPLSFALAQKPDQGGPSGMMAHQEGASLTNGDIYATVYQMKSHEIGVKGCTPNVNSSGFGAFLSAVGSESVLANDVWLECEDLPAFQNGIFIASQTSGSFPLGQGILCLSQPIFRIFPVLNSGPEGVTAVPLDMSNLPFGMSVQPGDTWHFQYWTRDGNFVNLSNSIRIAFGT